MDAKSLERQERDQAVDQSREADAAAKPSADYEKPKVVRVRRVLAAGGHSV